MRGKFIPFLIGVCFGLGGLITVSQAQAPVTFLPPTPGLIPAAGLFKWAGLTQIVAPSDGIVKFQTNAGTGSITLQFGTGGGSVNTPQLQTVEQANPAFYFRDSAGGSTANVIIESQKATTGQRYLCIDTTGKLVSSAAACSGT
jgi:hypothetical protein